MRAGRRKGVMVMIGYRDSGKCQHHYEDRGGAVLGKQWSQRSTSSSVSLSAAQHWHSVNTLLSIVQPTSGLLNPAEWGEWSDSVTIVLSVWAVDCEI